MKKFNLVKGLVISLMAFALAFAAFGAVSASAEDATPTPVAKPEAVAAEYNNAANTIKVTAKDAVVYVLKTDKGAEIKKGAKSVASLTKDQPTSLEDLKIKGTTKDVYLYICDKEFEAADKVDANLVIKAQAAKKVTVKIDYTKADNANATDVISIVATDKDKNVIPNATCVWSAEINGTYAASNTFKGANLAEKLAAGGEIFVKMVGNDSPAQFASKAVKVKIAKQAKAPKAKYDQKKDTIALKNGFDFGLATKVDEKYTVTTWYTILPANKEATKKTAAESIVATTTYVPSDKKEDTYKANTTQYKFKALPLDTIAEQIDAEGEFTLAVRKSATAKKPASDVTYITFAAQTAAPIVFTADKVASKYNVATAEEFEKKGFVIGTVANYNGTNGTTGFWNTFAIGEKGEGADQNPAAYEYLVVKQSDLTGNKIDWTTASWSKLDPAKTKITSKLKAKYSDVDGKKSDAKLAAINKPEGFNPTSFAIPENATILLVRRAGVKGAAPVRPSAYETLYVIKDGKSFILYSKTAVGAEADEYTIEFYTLQKKDGAYVWAKDEKIEALKGWTTAGAANVAVEFPEIAGAKFYAYDTESGAGDEITATQKKYTVELDAKVAVDISVKVTYDLNTPEGITTTASAPTAADTVKGKITVSTAELTGTKTVDESTTQNWKVTGWYLDKGLETAVTNNTIFGEAATIYAKWEVVPTTPEPEGE